MGTTMGARAVGLYLSAVCAAIDLLMEVLGAETPITTVFAVGYLCTVYLANAVHPGPWPLLWVAAVSFGILLRYALRDRVWYGWWLSGCWVALLTCTPSWIDNTSGPSPILLTLTVVAASVIVLRFGCVDERMAHMALHLGAILALSCGLPSHDSEWWVDPVACANRWWLIYTMWRVYTRMEQGGVDVLRTRST